MHHGLSGFSGMFAHHFGQNTHSQPTGCTVVCSLRCLSTALMCFGGPNVACLELLFFRVLLYSVAGCSNSTPCIWTNSKQKSLHSDRQRVERVCSLTKKLRVLKILQFVKLFFSYFYTFKVVLPSEIPQRCTLG